MFELSESQKDAIIKVIGVGGGGGNTIDHMIAEGIEDVEFICANTYALSIPSPAKADIICSIVDIRMFLDTRDVDKSTSPTFFSHALI